jgi:hypothetical protein
MALILRDCRPVITSGLQEPSLDGRYEEVLTLKSDASPLVRCPQLVVPPEVADHLTRKLPCVLLDKKGNPVGECPNAKELE